MPQIIRNNDNWKKKSNAYRKKNYGHILWEIISKWIIYIVKKSRLYDSLPRL